MWTVSANVSSNRHVFQWLQRSPLTLLLQLFCCWNLAPLWIALVGRVCVFRKGLWVLQFFMLGSACFCLCTWVYPLGASGDVSPNIPDSPTSALTQLLHPNRNALRFSSFSVSRFSTVHLFDQDRNQRLSLPALPLTSSCSTVWSVSLLCVWNAFLL